MTRPGSTDATRGSSLGAHDAVSNPHRPATNVADGASSAPPPKRASPMPYHRPRMDILHILDLEAAINHWRARQPAQAGAALAPAVAALAEVYARMAVERRDSVAADTLPADARDAWLAWYATTPDTPCIAICSTNQGDAVCKGCGRTEDEVRQWLSLTPFAKRAVWHRITQAQTAWRFTRYAERARESTGAAGSPAQAFPTGALAKNAPPMV